MSRYSTLASLLFIRYDAAGYAEYIQAAEFLGERHGKKNGD